MDVQPLQILLLEDDAGDASLIEEQLRVSIPGQFVCTRVSTVSETIEQIHTRKPDVILLDMDLPDHPRLEAFRNVRLRAGRIPILILSDREDQGRAVQAVAAGAEDYVVKGRVAISPLGRAIHHAVERERLRTELQNLTLTDSLTGLNSRRGFFMLAEEQLKLLHRSSQGLLLFLCEVHGMKAVNDSFGHGQGDQMLIDTAAILRGTFRSSDIIARLGGDEFVALAVGTVPATSELMLARLQANLNKHNARADGPYKLSFSTGVAYVGPGENATLEELISKADKGRQEQERARGKDPS